MENLAESLYEQVMESSNPGPILVLLCKSIFEDIVDKSSYGMIGRLNKVYGRRILFFAILDSVTFEPKSMVDLFKILSFFCKKRIEKQIVSTIDLTKLVEENTKFIKGES